MRRPDQPWLRLEDHQAVARSHRGVLRPLPSPTTRHPGPGPAGLGWGHRGHPSPAGIPRGQRLHLPSWPESSSLLHGPAAPPRMSQKRRRRGVPRPPDPSPVSGVASHVAMCCDRGVWCGTGVLPPGQVSHCCHRPHRRSRASASARWSPPPAPGPRTAGRWPEGASHLPPDPALATAIPASAQVLSLKPPRTPSCPPLRSRCPREHFGGRCLHHCLPVPPSSGSVPGPHSHSPGARTGQR